MNDAVVGALYWELAHANCWVAAVAPYLSLRVHRKSWRMPWRVEVFGNPFACLQEEYLECHLAKLRAEEKAKELLAQAVQTPWFQAVRRSR